MLISKIEPTENGVYVGGTVNALLTLVKYLGRHGVCVNVLASLNEKKLTLFQEYTPEGAGFTVLKNNRRPQSVMFGIVFLLKSIKWALSRKRRSYDIIHGHSGYAIYAWLTYLMATIIGCKRIHTVYCPLQKKGTVNNTTRFILKGKLATYALNKMDKIIAMSANVASSLVEAGVKRSKILVISTAIDSEKYRPRLNQGKIRSLLGLDKHVLLILFVGNLTKSKGLDVLIEAVGHIKNQVPPMKLILTLELKHAGFDERKRALRKRIEEMELDDNIIELGMIDYMPELIAEVDVVVSPYRDTQGPSDYPLAIMEAMGTGRCVVGTTVGGMPELIDDKVDGRLVPPADVHSLAEVIVELLEDPEKRQRLGREAYNKMAALYFPTRMICDHLNMYEIVMDQQ